MAPLYRKPLTILSVEDNPADAYMIAELLREASPGITVNHVGDGAEAIEYLKRQGRHAAAVRPDLILLDLNLPKKDGREVLAEIKRTPELASIAVLILSTSTNPEDVRRCYELHANCYFAKPMDLTRFQETIRALCDCWLKAAVLPGMEHENT